MSKAVDISSDENINLTDYEQRLSQLTFKLQRTLKNIRYCRKECRDTTKIIGEINGVLQKDANS